MALTATWVAVNIVAPVIIPIAGMKLGGKYMATTDEQREKAKIRRSMQQGQLGWLAVAWAAAAIYEAFDYMDDHGRWLKWVGGLTVAEACVVVAAMYIATGGAINADDKDPDDKDYMRGSIICALASAGLFAYAHFMTH